MQPTARSGAGRGIACAVTLMAALGACGWPDGAAAPAAGARDEATAVTVPVGGRTLAGSCLGAEHPGRPTVVLEPGLGNLGSELNSIAYDIAPDARVCSYDRAGLGRSAPARTPRTVADLVADLHAFLAGAGIGPPYVLVGHSLGGSLVLRYAQEHPDEVAGFVAMNPVPPYTTWLARARRVESAEELRSGVLDYYAGTNAESVDLRGTDLELTEPLAARIPYVVMFAEDCPGDFCDRIRPALRAATEELSQVGAGGRFVEVPESGHDIFLGPHSADIVREIRALLAR